MTAIPFRILLSGNWTPAQVQITYSPTDYTFPVDFVRRAEVFWNEILREGEPRVFNGALCRLEKFAAAHDKLQLSFSRTCYRDLLFSNANTAELITVLGENGPVRALGISAIIETVDSYLPLIRRSAHVGEAPGGLDVIGGHIHPDEHAREGVPDIFLAIQDEIKCELGIPLDKLTACRCCGLAENRRHRKPELAFVVALPLTMREIRTLAGQAPEAEEYTELFAIKADKWALQNFIHTNFDKITPATHGCFELYAKYKNWS